MTDLDKFGDLIIEFDVEYPRKLDSDQKLYIKEALLNNQHHKKQQQNRKKNITNEED